MKQSQLKQLIKEEIQKVLSETPQPNLPPIDQGIIDQVQDYLDSHPQYSGYQISGWDRPKINFTIKKPNTPGSLGVFYYDLIDKKIIHT